MGFSHSALHTFPVRGLGTHISRVRSVKMDSWSEDQVERMKRGGNQQCQEFLKSHGMEDFEKKSIRERYDSPQAELYKNVLDARIAGTPEPTELPKRNETPKTTTMPKKMEGFGSSPAPQPKQERKGLKMGAYVVASAFVTWYLVLRKK